MKRNKKGQEEMVGFVLIIIIVTIAVVMLLLFSSRKSSGIESSQEVENFLQASSYFTTSCVADEESFSLKKLIVACKNNERCDNGQASCEILDSTIKSLIDSGWGAVGNYNGYELQIYLRSKDNNETVSILQNKAGNLTGNWQAGDVLFPVPPYDYHIYLKVYLQ